MIFPIEITFGRPIEHDGKTYKSLTFDEITIGTQIAMEEENGGPRTILIALAGMAEVPLDVISKIRSSDFKTIEKCVIEPWQNKEKLNEESAAEMGNEVAKE